MGKDGAIELVESPQGYIEVRCVGYMGEERTDYLPGLVELVEKRQNVALIFNAERLTGFASSFAMAHIGTFKRWVQRVPKIAVVHTMPGVTLAISAVRLASNANMRGFSSRDEAVRWVTSPT